MSDRIRKLKQKHLINVQKYTVLVSVLIIIIILLMMIIFRSEELQGMCEKAILIEKNRVNIKSNFIMLEWQSGNLVKLSAAM